MLFNSYTNSNYQKKEIIDSFYNKIVYVSRSRNFYTKLSVPDTIDGRFDLLALFSIIFTFHLSKNGSKGTELSQVLFDKIFLDLDLSLRELGAGDTGVHIKIKHMIESYMGRQKVYCNCLERRDFKAFKKYIINNIYRNVEDYSNSPESLVRYCEKCSLLFEKISIDDFIYNNFDFPKL